MGQRDPRVDAYIAKSAEFARPILMHLRDTIHAGCPDAEEAIKWGMPAFLYSGRILCGIAAFKQHCALGFWGGRGLIGNEERRDDAMGQFGRIASLKDLPSKKVLIGYVKQAMKRGDERAAAGPKPKKPPKPAPPAPDDLVAALKKNKKAQAIFDAFSASCKREYIEWIVEAKREATRASRIDQAVEWMAEGKQRNWKYQNG
ncbi:MAG: YdeI/OmpD-associated family protein [Rudaea sp.]|uniref:YdeI/OmpD-associated family protein n=1 Tax=unclassified Rudaea TaxID=2627037 RepID=UPI0010F66715|nr:MULTISPECIES: YdeI/OmpD-associated family protein [unclassified Rudaea]MBN8884787.1 YdeI/OmpD-associated family protein [Rudaea sp.]MBR0345423.1 YdeI/OmpD-associated family protein [Rudaea sp.]